MSRLVKPLRYFVQAYLTIERNVVEGIQGLYAGKDALDALDREYNEQNTKSPDALVLADRTEPNQVKTWTTGDGSRVQVGAMTDQHLFYALAKARRGEYPDTHARATGIEALELEAFRRLRNKLTHTPVVNPPRGVPCDWCSGRTTAHTATCPTLSNP